VTWFFRIKRLLYDEGFTIAGARRFCASMKEISSGKREREACGGRRGAAPEPQNAAGFCAIHSVLS